MRERKENKQGAAFEQQRLIRILTDVNKQYTSYAGKLTQVK